MNTLILTAESAAEQILSVEHLVDHWEENGTLQDILRTFGYELASAMGKILDNVYKGVKAILSMSIEAGLADGLSDGMKIVGWVLLVLTMVIAAIVMITQHKQRAQLVSSITLSIALMIASPFIFSTMDSIRLATVNDLDEYITENEEYGSTMMKKQIIHVEGSLNKGKIVTLPWRTSPYYINIKQTLPREGAYKYKIESYDGSNELEMTETRKDIFFGDEEIYAYSVNWGILLVTQIITLIALLFAAFKLARTIFELIFKQLIAYPILATDMGSGRAKKYIADVIGSYLTFIIVMLLMALYMNFTAVIESFTESVFVKLMLLAGASWALIDGPDLIVKLLGVDAGVKSTAGAVMATTSAIQTGSRMLSSASRLATSTAGKGVGVATGAAGVMGATASAIKSGGSGIQAAYDQGKTDAATGSPQSFGAIKQEYGKVPSGSGQVATAQGKATGTMAAVSYSAGKVLARLSKPEIGDQTPVQSPTPATVAQSQSSHSTNTPPVANNRNHNSSVSQRAHVSQQQAQPSGTPIMPQQVDQAAMNNHVNQGQTTPGQQVNIPQHQHQTWQSEQGQSSHTSQSMNQPVNRDQMQSKPAASQPSLQTQPSTNASNPQMPKIGEETNGLNTNDHQARE